jgi:hypothetical protein
LEELLRTNGAIVREEIDGALAVSLLRAPQIGDLAGANGIYLHELAPQSASLEEAYMELTRESVEFHGEPVLTPDHTVQAPVPEPPLSAASSGAPDGYSPREEP